MGEEGGQLRGKQQLQGSKKERKKSTKTKGGKVEVMASFGIFLQLAILCFFTVSKVRAKHFMVETEGDVGDVEGGDYQDNGGSTNADAKVRHEGDGKGTGKAIAKKKVKPGEDAIVKATARCMCDCPPALPDELTESEIEVIAIA